jgi:hypothetical protein
MSQANVEVVKRVIDAYNRRDFDAYDELCIPDLEWSTAMGAVEGEIFRGRLGVERYMEAMDNAWEEFRAVVDECKGSWCTFPTPAGRHRRRTRRHATREEVGSSHAPPPQLTPQFARTGSQVSVEAWMCRVHVPEASSCAFVLSRQ